MKDLSYQRGIYKKIMITVITPTYNRGYILFQCYRSLLAQTDIRFQWLIVDDGSTDNTEEIVKEWIKENKIKIEYIKKQNGGKASALNLAIERLETKYAVCLDSDDIFFPQTVELAMDQLNEIESNDRYCGILALRNSPDGTVMGKRAIPSQYTEITAEDVFLRLNLRTELICFYKTDILKKYRFPEFSEEKFVSPAWMQYKITQNYKFKTSWDKLCQCEYVADGLTKNKRKIIIKNPKGYTCVKRYSFNLAPTLKMKIKHGIMYDCGCILGGNKDWLDDVQHRVLAIALMPVAYIVIKLRYRQTYNGEMMI